MKVLIADIGLIADAVAALTDKLLDSVESSEDATTSMDPALLHNALQQLMDVLRRLEGSNSPIRTRVGIREDDPFVESTDISEIGEYGIRLLAEAGHHAARNKLDHLALDFEDLTAALAIWLARQDAEIRVLEPVVNALSRAANNLRDTEDLIQLYRYISEISEAAGTDIQTDMDSIDPGRPWRVLTLNQAIVATRSHQPDLMEDAFDKLTARLPDDAPGFFREGMSQMEALDYPAHVRKIMAKYYTTWCSTQSLH